MQKVCCFTIQLQNGCVLEQEIEIRRSKNLTPYFFQTSLLQILPGNNNSFYPISPEGDVKTILSLRIYDRWGNLMFSRESFLPNDPTLGWDGHFNGCPVVPGVFVWTAEVLLRMIARRVIYSGFDGGEVEERGIFHQQCPEIISQIVVSINHPILELPYLF